MSEYDQGIEAAIQILLSEKTAEHGYEHSHLWTNMFRDHLIEKMKDSDLPIKTIQELKEEGEKICGKPQKLDLEDEIVAVIKWVDGTIIDSVRKIKY